MALRTLERSTLNEVNWLLYATPELYNLWKSVVNLWIEGSLAGANGKVLEKPRKVDSITENMFKCFEGDLTEVKIRGILQRVLDGKALLKNNENYFGDLPSMEELTKTVKFMRALRVKIQEYLHEKYPTHFPISTTWAYMEEKIPELQDEKICLLYTSPSPRD